MYRRSNFLFIIPVHTKKANLLNLNISSKLKEATGSSNINIRIKNDFKATSHMDLKQGELHYICNLSVIFVITSSSIHGILTLYNQEEIIMSNLLEDNDEDNEEMAVIDAKHFTRYTTDIVEPLQYLQMIIVDHALESPAKLNRYYKIFNPFLTDPPCVISSYKLKLDYFHNTLWFHPGFVDVYSTYIPMLMIPIRNVISNIDMFLKICNTSSIISDISNQNPTFIVRDEKCLQSTASIFILSNDKYSYCLQGHSFVEVFIKSQTSKLKRYSDDKHYLHSYYIRSISMVSHNVT